MRVAILGPLVDDKHSGGVSTFDEGLYNGFKNIGDDVFAISLIKSKNIDTVLIGNGNPSSLKIVLSARKIAKAIKEIKPDLVIASLHYTMGIKKYKRKWKNATYVQVLHGFPCPINGKFKTWLTNHSLRKSTKHFDKTISVSFLSYAINQKMSLIKCDGYIDNGCNLPVSDYIGDRKYDFIYVGRLAEDKGIRLIVESFINLKEKNPKLNFVVAGYGELEPEFKEGGSFYNNGIDFVGQLSQDQVFDYLSKSKFFISMNSLEPFGIVFCEAILCGCNVITQTTSGCIPILYNKKYYHVANCVNPNDLANRLDEIKDNFEKIALKERKEFSSAISFENVAKEYRKLYSKK